MDTPSKPEWLRIRPPTTEQFDWIRRQVAHQSLHTVCQEAQCPNMTECWSAGTATFMVLGDTCTRGCRFCAVKTGRKGLSVDPFEPEKLAATVTRMNLRYVVITSVDQALLGARRSLASVELARGEQLRTYLVQLAPHTLVGVLPEPICLSKIDEDFVLTIPVAVDEDGRFDGEWV